MDLTNLIIWIIVGAIGGWLASFFVKIPIGGIFGNIVAGIVGGLLVGWLSTILPILPSVTGLNFWSIIAAFIGAIIVAAVVGLLTRGRGNSTASATPQSASSTTKSASTTVSNTSSGATNTTKDAASGAPSTTKDAASGAASTTNDAASGGANVTKDAASGAASTTKDAASSAASMTKDAYSGAASVGPAAKGAAAGMAGAVSMDQMSGMLNPILGGNMDQMSGMLNGILGGNMKLDANSPLGQMVMPMADGVTAKLGLPKEVGQMVVVFALAKLTELMQVKMGKGAAASGNAKVPSAAQADEVLGKLNSGGGIDAGSLQSMGLSSELAKKTGISESQATQGLQYAFGALSAGLSGQKSYEGTTLPDMSMLKGMMK